MRARPHALVAEEILRHRPALAFLVDEVLGGHLHVVEEHLVGLVPAVHQDDGPHGDARGLHVDQEEGDAVLALLLRGIRAHEAEDPVRVMRERGPDLLPRHHVVVALAHRLGLERRQIGARAGLGVALAPEVVAAVDARQEALLLGVGAEAQQHRGAHPETEGDQRRGGREAALLLEDVALGDAPARAAPLHRPVRRHPALLGEDPVPAEKVVLGELLVASTF